MKRLFLAFWLLLLPIIGWAQSKYISYSPMGQEDREAADKIAVYRVKVFLFELF